MSTGMLEGQATVPNEDDTEKLAVAGGDQATAQPANPAEELDVDDLALAEMRRAAEAEEGGNTADHAAGQTQSGNPAGTQPAHVQDQGADGQPQGKGPKYVPIERFQQVYHERRDLQAEIARLAGENIALKSQVAPAQPAVNPQIAELEQQITSLAKKFDDGEITYSDLKAQELAVQRQLDAIRESDIVARAAQRSQPAPQTALPDLTFQRETKRLSDTYEAFVQLIPDAYLDSAVKEARAELAAEGITEVLPNSEELLKLRERLGQNAQRDAAFWAGKSGKPIPKPGQPPARTAAPNQPTPDQRRAKLEMQGEMPPNLTTLMRSGGLEDAPTEATIEGLSDEEISELPAAYRNKLLGLTP